MPEMTQQVPQIPQVPSALATTTPGTSTDPAAAAAATATDPAAAVATTADPAAAAAAPAPAAQSGGGVMSAMLRLFGGLFDPPAATGPQEKKDLPVAVGDGVKSSYDTFSAPAPGVDPPDNPLSGPMGWVSTWWPAMKAAYEMMTKGTEKADSGTVGEGVTGPLKSLLTAAVDSQTGVPGSGAMVGQVLDGAQQYVDLRLKNPGGVNGMIGDEIKKTGKMIQTAGNQVLDDTTSVVNTVGGGAVGVADATVAAAQHALGVDDGTPLDLPTELPPIEERMETEWPPPMAPAAPAAPAQSVVLPAADEDSLAV